MPVLLRCLGVFVLTVAIAFGALARGAGAVSASYVALDLGTLGGSFSRAVAVNDGGR